MSTKIYYGARIPHGIAKAHKLLVEAKPQAVAIAQREQNKVLAWLVASTERDKGEAPTPFIAWADLEKARRELRHQGLRHGADYDFELCLFPRGGHTLAMPFVDEPLLRDWFLALPFVEEYGYWNNTDQPEDVTDRQWDARERAWAKALGPTWRPSDRGLTFDLVKSANLDFPHPGPEWDAFKVEAEAEVERIAAAKAARQGAQA